VEPREARPSCEVVGTDVGIVDPDLDHVEQLANPVRAHGWMLPGRSGRRLIAVADLALVAGLALREGNGDIGQAIVPS
jgi:hypothetical protein